MIGLGLRLALLAALLAGCATSRPALPELRDEDYPGLLRPPTALGPDVLLQQRVTASWGDGQQRGFDAALQKQGDNLTLIGLSPLGTMGFVLQQRGTEIELRNESGEPLPFPPRFILIDVQRVFFPWLLEAGAIRPDGEHAADLGEERVSEVVRAGRLVERRFTRLDGVPQGTITVRYTWDLPGSTAPSHATLDNGWFGYRLTIQTLREVLLP